MTDIAQPTWYLLFGGQSVDGMGLGEYIGRTIDKQVAIKHWKACEKDPYSTGKVIIVTDTKHARAIWLTDFDKS